MQTYYIGNGKVTEGGHDRDATREELIEFLRAGSADRARDTERHLQMLETVRKDKETTVASLNEEIAKLSNFYVENSGAVSKDFPQTLNHKYLGDGKMQIGDVCVTMSRQFLIEHLDIVQRLLNNERDEVKKLYEQLKLTKEELSTFFRKSVENNETECRTLEVFLHEQQKHDTDFLVTVYDYPLQPPNEIDWNSNVTLPASAIAGLRMYNGGWGFVHLSGYEKNAIGKAFSDGNLIRGKYYWCTMSYYPNTVVVVK